MYLNSIFYTAECFTAYTNTNKTDNTVERLAENKDKLCTTKIKT